MATLRCAPVRTPPPKSDNKERANAQGVAHDGRGGISHLDSALSEDEFSVGCRKEHLQGKAAAANDVGGNTKRLRGRTERNDQILLRGVKVTRHEFDNARYGVIGGRRERDGKTRTLTREGDRTFVDFELGQLIAQNSGGLVNEVLTLGGIRHNLRAKTSHEKCVNGLR